MKQFSFYFLKTTLIILFIGLCSCDSSAPKKQVTERSQEVSYPKSYNTNLHTASDTVQHVEPVQQPESEQTPKEELQQSAPLPSSTKVTISKYYEEGYEKGYDDGEDDAVMDNGWYEQFDDSNPYKGKNRKDYELGYEEGYEAGYYDNKADDD